MMPAKLSTPQRSKRYTWQNPLAGYKRLSPRQLEQRYRRLKELLRIADDSFKDQTNFRFPESLLEIPVLVSELQQRIGRKTAYRPRFGDCINALDHEDRKLQLKKTLHRIGQRLVICHG